ncbi:hypothetical protein DPMN_004686 [Dreissena polymorpha]|uniref:Uncharacterized protein n=1 Tax=Dreissena polymorpha TaxID=45954 RepID=A0A9D4MR93_DREPO|nr:hypothetical protein DPMN_004686 [Dreissena polymorpha]
MRKLQVMRMLKNQMTSMMKKIEKVFLHLAQNLLCLGFILNMDIKEQGMTRMIMMMIWVIQIGFTIKESMVSKMTAPRAVLAHIVSHFFMMLFTRQLGVSYASSTTAEMQLSLPCISHTDSVQKMDPTPCVARNCSY